MNRELYFMTVLFAGPHCSQDDREGAGGRVMGGAAELSPGHQLDAQAGEDL